mmetsp:Transcript_12753/g.32615  ORF Transcript_12753/g.32615 Transcript_12753/m.32615 type:complete len:93 (-) Transcript_12753:588-866(-)
MVRVDFHGYGKRSHLSPPSSHVPSGLRHSVQLPFDMSASQQLMSRSACRGLTARDTWSYHPGQVPIRRVGCHPEVALAQPDDVAAQGKVVGG